MYVKAKYLLDDEKMEIFSKYEERYGKIDPFGKEMKGWDAPRVQYTYIFPLKKGGSPDFQNIMPMFGNHVEEKTNTGISRNNENIVGRINGMEYTIVKAEDDLNGNTIGNMIVGDKTYTMID